jgi:hypothetical protein
MHCWPFRLPTCIYAALVAVLFLGLQPTKASASPATYIATVLPWVQQAHSLYGIPISVAIAQSAKESGWILPKANNNFFNITYLGPGCDPYTIGPSGNWRAYLSGQDAMLGYGFFITNDGNYTGLYGAKIDCRPDLNNPLQFLHDIAFDGFDGGPNAATSVKQGYYDAIKQIMDENNLTQYDVISTDIYVDKNNGNSGQNGSSSNPYSTVKQAVDTASATQPVTIHIAPGAYHETISTSKHIHFVVNGSGSVTIGG